MIQTQRSINQQDSATARPQAIRHALCLHLYQPPGNLRHLLQHDQDELRSILLAYQRIPRHAAKYADVARLHVALSPVLLEQLADPQFIDDCRHLADVPAILEQFRSAAAIEFIGTGYRHAPLPLVPPQDWDEQLHRERLVIEAQVGRVLRGYWPPVAHFNRDMVPALVRAGYRYVLLPGTALATSQGDPVDPYRCYRLTCQDAVISVVPYDLGFSRAQETGLDAPWFADEVRNGVAQALPASAPYLLTTWSDGENGEWFRRPEEEQGFFGQFFSPYMEFCETGEFPVRPVHLSDQLSEYPAEIDVDIAMKPAAALPPDSRPDDTTPRARLAQMSNRYWSAARTGPGQPNLSREALQKAHELILRAEDSCFLLGGEEGGRAMLELLGQADKLLQAPSTPVLRPAVTRRKPPVKRKVAAKRSTRTGRKKTLKPRP